MTNTDATRSSETYEWFTPDRFLVAVREVLGAIDLDPASCAEANREVRAAHIYTLEDDGLLQSWLGRVFCNPPYGWDDHHVSRQEVWSKKFAAEYASGNVSEGILLVNAQTGEQWFQHLWRYPICFTDHRIRFKQPEGAPKKDGPTHGSVFVYFGSHDDTFTRVFRQFGRIVLPEGVAEAAA
jgi:ParB family chromosome partitioning protein